MRQGSEGSRETMVSGVVKLEGVSLKDKKK